MSDRGVDSPARARANPDKRTGFGPAAGKPALVGWIVDVQEDFMNPEGRLYVRNLFDGSDPGAAEVIPALESATAWMRAHCDVIVYTGDWHGFEDDEIDPVAPDPAAGTYPPHCMGRSPDADERAGAEVIAEIRPRDPVVLAHDAKEEDAVRVAWQAVAERRPVFVQKTRFNVFEGNAACEAFVRSLGEAVGEVAGARGGGVPPVGDEGPAHDAPGRALEFVVIGVARDVCVTQAVDGLQERGYAVTAVRDATWGLGLEAEAATLARWAGRGRVVALAELLDG